MKITSGFIGTFTFEGIMKPFFLLFLTVLLFECYVFSTDDETLIDKEGHQGVANYIKIHHPDMLVEKRPVLYKAAADDGEEHHPNSRKAALKTLSPVHQSDKQALKETRDFVENYIQFSIGFWGTIYVLAENLEIPFALGMAIPTFASLFTTLSAETAVTIKTIGTISGTGYGICKGLSKYAKGRVDKQKLQLISYLKGKHPKATQHLESKEEASDDESQNNQVSLEVQEET